MATLSMSVLSYPKMTWGPVSTYCLVRKGGLVPHFPGTVPQIEKASQAQNNDQTAWQDGENGIFKEQCKIKAAPTTWSNNRAKRVIVAEGVHRT